MKRYSVDFLETIATDIFSAAGAPRDEARIVAEHLVMSNLMGMDSHGVVRIPLYLRWIREGTIRPGAAVTLEKEEGAMAVFDCGYNFGQVGALRATEKAIEKARELKVALVLARRCCHVGRVGHYTQMIAGAGMFGLAVVNSPKSGHSVVPFGGLEGRLAPNPISYAVPGPENPMLSDMALSTTAQGKVVVYRNRRQELPEGWVIDADGNPSTDPNELFKYPRGWILPLGGKLGYKGYALLLLAEVLTGVLAGHRMTDDIPDGTNVACFVVVDLSAFQPEEQIREAIGAMATYVKSAPPAPGFKEVVMPGEIDFRFRAERETQGIPIEPVTWRRIRESAEALGVAIVDGG